MGDVPEEHLFGAVAPDAQARLCRGKRRRGGEATPYFLDVSRRDQPKEIRETRALSHSRDEQNTAAGCGPL
jgi:hypothetical protein